MKFPTVEKDTSDAIHIGMLPFVNVNGDATGEILCKTLDNQILELLTKRTITATHLCCPQSLGDSDIHVREAGHRLDADWLLFGNVRRHSGRFESNALLIDAESGLVIWTSRLDSPSLTPDRAADVMVSALVSTVDRVQTTGGTS